MADDEWIAYRGAVALIGDEGAVLRALMTGRIKSRGRRDYGAEEDIPADRWAEWTFLPAFKGAGSMRKFCWLVPPGSELSRVCRGFGEIRLLRADVERLVAPATSPPARAGAGLPAKENLDESAAAILRDKFPRRPPHKRETLRGIVSEALGREISLETLKRAMASAWSVAQNGSK
jgi:hypothetical protein